MAKFCESCGAAMEGMFCGKCGARAGSGSAAPQPVQAQPPAYTPPAVQNMQSPGAAPKKGSNTVLKIVFIVLGVLLLFGILASVGLYWAASKVKDKVEQVAAQSGVDLKKLASQGSDSPSSQGGDGCWLLPQAEAERITGFKIVRAGQKPDGEAGKLTCQYFADPAELAKTAQSQTESAVQALKGSKGANQPADLQQLEKFAKGMLAGAASGEAGNGLLFELAVRRGGGQSDWAGVSIASKTMGGLQPVSGVGDHALMGPMAVSLFAIKGDNFLELSMGGLPDGRQKGIEIARAIFSRL